MKRPLHPLLHPLLLAAFAVYAGIVCCLILTFNPTLFTASVLSGARADSALVWKPIIFEKLEVNNTEKISMLRASSNRDAIFDLPKLNFDLKSIWKTVRINVGIHDASKSSVIADNEQIYVGGDDSWFHAFDLTGKEVWRAYLSDAPQGIHGSALVDGHSVFIGSYRGTLYRFDKKTGRPLWARILGQAIGSSPVAIEDDLIVGIETNAPGGYLVRIKRESGDIVWKSRDLGGQTHSSPSIDLKNGLVLTGANNFTVQAFDLKSGQPRWMTKLQGEVKSSIAIYDGIAYITSFGREIVALDSKNGALVWRRELPNRSMVSPAVLPEARLVVAASSAAEIVAFDLTSGATRWVFKTKNRGMKSSPIVIRSGKIEKVIAVCGEKQFCLFSSTGKVEKRWSLSGQFSGSPFTDGKNFYFAYDDGGVETFKIIF